MVTLKKYPNYAIHDSMQQYNNNICSQKLRSKAAFSESQYIFLHIRYLALILQMLHTVLQGNEKFS